MTSPARVVYHVVSGQPWQGHPAGRVALRDPATREPIGEVLSASTADVDEVVALARGGQARWAAHSLARRSQVLFAFRQLVIDHRDELMDLICLEHGKVPGDAGGELDRGLENVEFACGLSHHLKGSSVHGVSTGVNTHERRFPIGVVAGITPFNFPVMVPLWMSANAIACGNAFVLKPSEKVPSAPALLGTLWHRAGLPDGVFTVLHGDQVVASTLVEHPGVDAVSFVGSTPVANSVYERATAAGKRVQALGGAKNHLVVLPGADLGAAADATVSAAFGSAGQRCMAVSVLVVVGETADEVVEHVAKRALDVRVGPASDPQAEMGPLITEAQQRRAVGYVQDAEARGATLVLDGRDQLNRPGNFLGPTILDHVAPDMACYRDEIFGPVLSVVRVADLDEAIELINSGPFGNGAAIFSNDGAMVDRFTNAVACGMVGVNVPLPVPAAAFSFGGWRSSLFGDINIYGPDGFRFYTRTKTVTTRWVHPRQPASLEFPSEGDGAAGPAGDRAPDQT